MSDRSAAGPRPVRRTSTCDQPWRPKLLLLQWKVCCTGMESAHANSLNHNGRCPLPFTSIAPPHHHPPILKRAMMQRLHYSSLLLLSVLAIETTLVSAQSTALLDFTSPNGLPLCAQQCVPLYSAQGACVPPAVPATNTLDQQRTCFCQSPFLQSLYAAPTGLCDAACPAAGELDQLRNWFTSSCAASQKPAGQPGAAPSTSTAAAAATSSPGGARAGANSSNPPPPSNNQSWSVSPPSIDPHPIRETDR